MTGSAQQIVQRAEARAAHTHRHNPKPDYQAANKAGAHQKAALTRAVNTKDPNKVIFACHKTVNEWSRPPFDGAWPDDWSRWQRVLDDVLHWPQRILLEDLIDADPISFPNAEAGSVR